MDFRVHGAGVVCIRLISAQLSLGLDYLIVEEIFTRIGLKFGCAPLAAEMKLLSVVIHGYRLCGVNLHPANRVLKKLFRRIDSLFHGGAFHEAVVRPEG